MIVSTYTFSIDSAIVLCVNRRVVLSGLGSYAIQVLKRNPRRFQTEISTLFAHWSNTYVTTMFPVVLPMHKSSISTINYQSKIKKKCNLLFTRVR